MTEQEIKKLEEERLAFGFDSLCFRYIIARNELMKYQKKDKTSLHFGDNQYWENLATRDKMRFIQVLDDIIGEHK